MAVNFDPAIIGRVFETTDPVVVDADDIRKFNRHQHQALPVSAKRSPFSLAIDPPAIDCRLSHCTTA